MQDFNKILDKSFVISEDTLLKWHCKYCKKENKEFVKDTATFANLTTTACYDCGTINILDLKDMKVIQ